jgi:hypothetical protein
MSKRNIDNGKTMMEKAQDFKRKWNMYEIKGITIQYSSFVSKEHIVMLPRILALR